MVLVLLTLAVVLTLVLFVLSRSVTDILVSSSSEQSARAFSAAEAGIEQSLIIGTGGQTLTNTLSNNSGYVSTTAKFAEGSKNFDYPIELFSGDSMTTWFINHNDDGTKVCNDTDKPCFKGTQLEVCWGKPGTAVDANAPAIETSIFYETTPGDLSTVRIARFTSDPYTATRSPSSGFDPISGGCSFGNYSFSRVVNFSDLGIAGADTTGNILQFARIRIFYNNIPQTVGVGVTGDALPSQGKNIISTGNVTIGTSVTASRRVQVFQGWPEPPSVFDFAIYSSTGLTK